MTECAPVAVVCARFPNIFQPTSGCLIGVLPPYLTSPLCDGRAKYGKFSNHLKQWFFVLGIKVFCRRAQRVHNSSRGTWLPAPPSTVLGHDVVWVSSCFESLVRTQLFHVHHCTSISSPSIWHIRTAHPLISLTYVRDIGN